MVEVTTQEELKKAIKSGSQEIIIKDEQLGKKVVKFMKIKKMSRWGVGIAVTVIIASIPMATVTAPATGGLSFAAAPAAAAAASGLSVSTVIAIAGLFMLSASTLYALHKDYDCEMNFLNIGWVKLTKKKSAKNA